MRYRQSNVEDPGVDGELDGVFVVTEPGAVIEDCFKRGDIAGCLGGEIGIDGFSEDRACAVCGCCCCENDRGEDGIEHLGGGSEFEGTFLRGRDGFI